jgi:hypothetical protein
VCAKTGGSREYIVYKSSSYFDPLRDAIISSLKEISLSFTVAVPAKEYSPKFSRTISARNGFGGQFLEFPYDISFHLNESLGSVDK